VVDDLPATSTQASCNAFTQRLLNTQKDTQEDTQEAACKGRIDEVSEPHVDFGREWQEGNDFLNDGELAVVQHE
jgi:hypothetical protein